MDHLLQIPQVGRAWDPIPEAYVTLGYLAGVTERVELGALVTPVTFRSAPLLAKMLASLDAVTGGRVFCGLGAGWFEREHAAYDLPFPTAKERLDALEATIGVLRAFWGPGTKPFAGIAGDDLLSPARSDPDHRGRRRRASHAGDRRPARRTAATSVRRCRCSTASWRSSAAMRPGPAAAWTSCGSPCSTCRSSATTPDDVARLVEAHRGRTSAKAYAAAHHAGTIDQHIDRYRQLAERGVHTVFVSFPNLTGPAQIERFAPIIAAAQGAVISSHGEVSVGDLRAPRRARRPGSSTWPGIRPRPAAPGYPRRRRRSAFQSG